MGGVAAMKKTASAVLAAALFLLVVNYNERDALPAAHVRGLKQYLQTSGEETISMDDNGMMTSTSTFTITDFSEHIKRVKHHVHNAHKRIKESVKRVVSNLKKHVGIGEDEAGDKEGATRKEITAFVNRPEGWRGTIGPKRQRHSRQSTFMTTIMHSSSSRPVPRARRHLRPSRWRRMGRRRRGRSWLQCSTHPLKSPR